MIRPLTRQCLLEIIPHDEMTAGGIVIPDIAQGREKGEKEKPFYARVIAVGPWRKAKNGFAILPEIKPGDRVLVTYYSGTKLTRHLGEKLRLCRVDDVLAVVE